MLPDDLNSWLTEIGGAMVEKQAAGVALTPIEQMIYEIWALDTQTRNGGLSQYFCNYGLDGWKKCSAAAIAVGLATFGPFAEQVTALIGDSKDPYKVLIKKGRAGDDVYNRHSSHIVSELREKFSTVA
jgi:hypothetical protein